MDHTEVKGSKENKEKRTEYQTSVFGLNAIPAPSFAWERQTGLPRLEY